MNTKALEQLCETASSFYERGYSFGSTGNLSVRIGDEIWITPTGKSLKNLTPERLACIDIEGKSYNVNKPSIYRAHQEVDFHPRSA
ncbi:MAG TPA: class II aldolase/adducin family protein [Pyrinomonadaceae bacterium]|nr:class II aldolase/adducin family protein [Pyrinomonadaceae bacterium]